MGAPTEKSMEGKDLLEFAGKCLDRAKALGAPEADVYVQDETELSVRAYGGEVEALRSATTRGMGIRIINGGRLGYAYASGLDEADAEQAIRAAMENAAFVEPDEHNRLPQLKVEEVSEEALGIYDARFADVPTERKVDFALELEQATRDQDPSIALVETAVYAESCFTVGLANSAGFSSSYRGTDSYCYAAPVAREGDESHSGFGFSMGRSLPELDMQGAAGEAAQRAVWLLGAKSLKPRKTTVVLDNIIAAEFLGAISGALTAEAVQRGRSLFAGKVGKAVASPRVTVVDDGALANGIASAPFDGEGVPSGRTVLIKEGTLQGFLHNTYTAAKDGVSSTGNGVRDSFKSTPEVGTTNFFITPGRETAEEIIRRTDHGLYVTEVMGMHTANPISGDFSVGATGLLIERGQTTRPVRGVAVAGNVLDLLQKVDGVGSDLTFFGGKGCPTLRVAEMSISG
ncbi:MAG: TldD/PmbA family protein [Actinobacteria bacterium]|nr:TldD/PmbA family protein [Actinomycetota bacterium]